MSRVIIFSVQEARLDVFADSALAPMLHTANSSKSFRDEASPKSFDLITGLSTSVLQYRHGRKSGDSGLNAFNLATLNKTLMLNGSIGRCGTNGSRSTMGHD